MFELRSNLYITNSLGGNHFESRSPWGHSILLNQAINLFNQARLGGFLEVVKSNLLRRTSNLLGPDRISTNCIRNRRYAGINPVSTMAICGTLGRVGDFDRCFHPLSDRMRDRWVSIAMARSQNIPLAPVELVQVGEVYFVKDGHHRISVARALGETAIDAEVVIWDTACALPWESQKGDTGISPPTSRYAVKSHMICQPINGSPV